MVVESYLNLLEVLAQPSAPDVAAAVCREALPPAAALLAASDDPSEASAATALLVQLVGAGGVWESRGFGKAGGGRKPRDDGDMPTELTSRTHRLLGMPAHRCAPTTTLIPATTAPRRRPQHPPLGPARRRPRRGAAAALRDCCAAARPAAARRLLGSCRGPAGADD